jgi:hypothetical protein
VVAALHAFLADPAATTMATNLAQPARSR